MIEWVAAHLGESLLILGIGALVLEVAVFGFATFVLFFLGVSLIVSGLLMQFGALADTLENALWANVIITTVLAVVLYKPLGRLQNQTQRKTVTSDFAELVFLLDNNVDINGNTTYDYSGITWKLKSEAPLNQGTKVRVVKKDVGVLWVAPTD